MWGILIQTTRESEELRCLQDPDGPSLTLCTTLPWQTGQLEGCPLESRRWDILKIIVRTGAGGAQAT